MARLLARRNRLVEELAGVDLELAGLRAAAARDPAARAAPEAARWLPIRGAELASGRMSLPTGIDRNDLDRRLGKILVDERQGGRPLDGLEVLVAFRPTGGRVLSIRTRRPGDSSWVRRFELPASGDTGS